MFFKSTFKNPYNSSAISMFSGVQAATVQGTIYSCLILTYRSRMLLSNQYDTCPVKGRNRGTYFFDSLAPEIFYQGKYYRNNILELAAEKKSR